MLKSRQPTTFLTVALLLAASPATAQLSEYQAAFQELTGLSPDPSLVARVTNLTLERDVARLHLTDGQLVLLSPVRERTMAALFIGQGRFSFAPPTRVEQEQLNRLHGEPSVSEPFRTLFLLFADSTLQELQSQLEFGPGPVEGNPSREIEEALEYLSEDEGEWFDSHIMTAILNEDSNGAFYAHLAQSRGDPWMFRIDPYSTEEVTLARRLDGGGKSAEVLCRFHWASDYQAGYSEPDDARDLAHLDNYDIESTIENNLDFSARASFDVTALAPNIAWIPIRLYSDLEVDGVELEGGAPLEWYRGKESGLLWLRFTPLLEMRSTRRLTVRYHGELLERADLFQGMRMRGDLSRNFMISSKSTSFWFPRYGSRRKATFDLTFHTPAKYAFVSVGDRVASEENGDVLTSRWQTRDVRNVAFNIGEFEEYEFDDPRIPPVTLQVAEKLHRTMNVMGADGRPLRFLQQNDMEEMVNADLSNALSFFQDFFGAPTVNHFYATEIPFFHGEAFPGMVMLSWITFQWTDDEGGDEIFRAHEVAHQWWGIGVDFSTYHDQWISEGFSEFAGLWYMQNVLYDDKLYMEKLEDSRKALLDRGDEAGPIWLGYRVANSEAPRDYSLVVYQKGAWVLHMLRNMFLDLDTMNEDRFKAMMSDFYQTYRGERASTEDFMQMVEDHAGIPMDWFFDQWVYGTGIPRYRFSHTGEETTDGYVARVRIVQENVPADFKMYVPLLLDFKDDGYARLRLLVEGPVTDVELPVLPRKPDRIVFNDLESVLAEVKNVGWSN